MDGREGGLLFVYVFFSFGFLSFYNVHCYPTPTPTLIDQIDGSLLSGCAKVIALVPEFDYSTQGRSTQSHHPTS